MRNKIRITSLLVLLLMSLLSSRHACAQDSDTAYHANIRQMVKYLEFTFNALGNDELTPQEKDVIVNESYLKVFRDGKVQIEDDLDPTRQTVSNKDVQAYLKDINFFFKSLKFELTIEEISLQITEASQLSYKVKIQRLLHGILVNNDSINNVMPRYIEINVNEAQQDLKIASIYTTKLNEKEELIEWWNNLTPHWKSILGQSVVISDTLPFSSVSQIADSVILINGIEHPLHTDISGAIKKIQSIDSLILKDDQVIENFNPIGELTTLTYLDVSNTRISDLMPLRSLNNIEVLKCANTPVKSLEPIRYCIKLKCLDLSATTLESIEGIRTFAKLENLNVSNTTIDSISGISSLPSIKTLNISSTNVKKLSPLESATQLLYLDISNTPAVDLTPLKSLKKLKDLHLNQTQIDNLEALEKCEALEILSANNSKVSNLTPLKNLSSLKRIELNNSGLGHAQAADFLQSNPKCTLIYASEELKTWHDSMSEGWKNVIIKGLNSTEITDEQLHALLKIDSVDIRGHEDISTLDPLANLYNIRYLNCEGSAITDLSPISEKTNLEWLNFNKTFINSLLPLSKLTNIKHLECNDVPIADITPLAGIASLEYISFNGTQVSDISVIDSLTNLRFGYFDNTSIGNAQVSALKIDPVKTIIVFRSNQLRDWWGNLEDEWQDVIKKYFDYGKRPTSEELHIITNAKKFAFSSLILDKLNPISEFVLLEDLEFHDTQISNLRPLADMHTLKSLNCSRNPITDLTPIAKLVNLEKLNLDYTPITDLLPIAELKNLKELKISGTEIRDLSPLAGLTALEVLECPKAKIRSLKGIEELPNLKVLKCYNNNINQKRIDSFKEAHPDCEVVFY